MNNKSDTRTIQEKVNELAKAGLHVTVRNIKPDKKYIIMLNIRDYFKRIDKIIKNIVFYIVIYILAHLIIFGGYINIHLNNPLKVGGLYETNWFLQIQNVKRILCCTQ